MTYLAINLLFIEIISLVSDIYSLFFIYYSIDINNTKATVSPNKIKKKIKRKIIEEY